MSEARYLTTEELHAGLDEIRRSPREEGLLVLIVRRPAVNEREVVEHGQLDRTQGLVGDTWNRRGSSRSVDGGPHPEMQINIMNARAIALVAQTPERWPLAGDQLFVDLDLSPANLPAGTQLSIGTAIIEVTKEPHTGCAKFVSRFGVDAMKFVNSTIGRELSLRGINAKVVRAGEIRVGDVVRKLAH
jgi:MOSC domain-containing protein YiiM